MKVTGKALVMPRKKIFYGWWVVLAASLMHFFGGGTFYYGFTVFFNPIRQTFGWTAATTSIAYTLQRLEAGLLGPVAGFLVDRVGPRRLMLIGWSFNGLGFILMSRINSLWAFYGAFFVIATSMSFASGMISNTAVAHWFSKKRSRALTFAFLGAGASGLLVPLLALLIGRFGWRETLAGTGIVLLAICVPLSLLMRHKPSQYGYLPDGEKSTTDDKTVEVVSPHHPMEASTRVMPSGGFTVKEVLRTRAFWLLSLVFLFQYIGNSALVIHIVPYLESVGISTPIAAAAVTGVTVCSVIGRVSFGFLGDYFRKRYLITIALGLQTIGMLIFSFIVADSLWLIALFLLLYAPGYGGPIPLRPALQADYFGTRNFGTISGLMSLVIMLGGLGSPVIAGWIFDVTGSYRLAWQIFTVVTIPAIPLMLLAKSPLPEGEPRLRKKVSAVEAG